MTQPAFFPTPESFGQALASTKELGDIQLRLYSELAERQKGFLSSWWQRQTAYATSLTTLKDLTGLTEATQKAASEELESLQKHTQATLELLNGTGKSISEWYEKQLAGLSGAAPKAAPPARVAPASTTKAA